jgi:uncharacterized LabA/DUF88 family protein
MALPSAWSEQATEEVETIMSGCHRHRPDRSRLASSDRSFHVLDLENLVCGQRADRVTVGRLLRRYDRAVARRELDLAVAAASLPVYEQLAFDLPSTIRCVPAGHGRDAADRKLQELVDPMWVAQRFDRAVIGSGDGFFIGLRDELQRQGCPVWVVGYSWTMSSALAAGADVTILLDGPTRGPALAA